MRIDGKTLPNNPMKAYQQGKLIGTKQNMDLVSEVLLTKFGFHVLEETPDSHDTMSIEVSAKVPCEAGECKEQRLCDQERHCGRSAERLQTNQQRRVRRRA